MSKYVTKPIVVEAVTFDELVQHGREVGASIVNGMPWSFDYQGFPVSHENDDCYLITTPKGTIHLGHGDVLIVGEGHIAHLDVKDFETFYEATQ